MTTDDLLKAEDEFFRAALEEIQAEDELATLRPNAAPHIVERLSNNLANARRNKREAYHKYFVADLNRAIGNE